MKALQNILIPLLVIVISACNNDRNKLRQAAAWSKQVVIFDQNNKPIEGKKKTKILANFLKKNEPQKNKNEFVINADEENEVICEQGTKIHIKPNSLVYEKTGKPVKGKAKIRVREYYQLRDFLSHRLTTTCNDSLLESGGTLYIEAIANGKNLAIKEGEEMLIDFPTKDYKPGMMTFEGQKNGNFINWTLSPSYRDTFYINQAKVETKNSPASFPSGSKSLDKFIADNTSYPRNDYQNAIEGPIFVRFTVRRNGKICNIHLLNKRHPSLDSVALSVVKKLPPFKPAVFNKKYCSYSITIPVKFYLWYNKYNPQYYMEELQCDYLLGKDDPDYIPSIDDDSTKTEKREYQLVVRRFGWINCDRFPKLKTTQWRINTDADQVMIIFRNLKSIMNATRIDSNHHIARVPYGEKVSIIAIKQDKKKNYYYARKETAIGLEPISKLIFKETTKADFQKILENYN